MPLPTQPPQDQPAELGDVDLQQNSEGGTLHTFPCTPCEVFLPEHCPERLLARSCCGSHQAAFGTAAQRGPELVFLEQHSSVCFVVRFASAFKTLFRSSLTVWNLDALPFLVIFVGCRRSSHVIFTTQVKSSMCIHALCTEEDTGLCTDRWGAPRYVVWGAIWAGISREMRRSCQTTQANAEIWATWKMLLAVSTVSQKLNTCLGSDDFE